MNIKRWILAALAGACVLLLAEASLAAGFTKCETTAYTGRSQITPGKRFCYEFVNADGTTQSTLFTNRAETMEVVFDADTLVAGVPSGTPAVVDLMHCPACGVASTLACEAVRLTTALTGVPGTAAAQLRSLEVPRGCYYIDVTTEAPASDVPRVYLFGLK